MAAYDYDCPTVMNDLIAETGRYMQTVAMKGLPYMPWNVNTPRGTWERGKGIVRNSIIFERTVPTAVGDEWADNAFSDDQGSQNCDYDPETIEFGQTSRNYRRQSREIITPWFCIEDLLETFSLPTFLKGMAKNMMAVSKYVWADIHRKYYSALSEHKLTANAAFDISNDDWDASDPPTSVLLNGHLERVRDYYDVEGLFDGASIGVTSTGSQVLTVLSSSNTIRNLIRQDPDLREDFRYAYMGDGDKSPLIKAYGSSIAYNGFKYVKDLPRRWDIVGGEYVERFPYLSPEAATKGKKQEFDPRYLYAEYEDTVIHIPSVYKELVPKAMGNLGSGFNFTQQNYMGEFEFFNTKDVKCNPRGNKGYFSALFSSAAEPGDTWLGVVIRHKTCSPDIRPVEYCYS